MSELTKEYLDKKLDKLATKDDLKDMEGSLKLHTEEEIGKLAIMTANGIEEIKRELDVRKEVDQLKTQMKKVWDALNIVQK